MKVRAVKNDRGVFLHSDDIADLLFHAIVTPCTQEAREVLARKVYDRIVSLKDIKDVTPRTSVKIPFEVIPAIEI